MRRNPPAKWVLPNVVNPATSTSWCVPVPDDPYHRAAFLGALASLGSAYKWQDDLAHTAKEVALVWQNIADNLERCMSEQPILRYYEDDTMPIRVDCDCNVFVTCCDGTEIQLATLADITKSNQPGSGTRPPAGESTCFPVTLNAKNTWLLPFSVSTDDVLTVTDLKGAWSSDGLAWTCPDGTPFVAGVCLGSRYHAAGDPSGSLFHGQLAYLISGIYYSATDGPFTVPGGVSGASVYLVPNLEKVLSAAGDVVFKVCAENGSAPPATSGCTFLDFTVSDYGFVEDTRDGYNATWVPGTGWIAGQPLQVVDIKFTLPGTLTVSEATLYGYVEDSDISGSGGGVWLPVPDAVFNAELPNAGVWELGGSTPRTGTVLQLGAQSGGDAANLAITGLLIQWTGVDPFGLNNC